jgi:S1-C subfamily serine protease
MKKFLTVLALIILTFAVARSDWGKKSEDLLIPKEKQTVLIEESVVTQVVEKSLPSVVTIGITQTARNSLQLNPFSPFRRIPQQKPTERNIGSGFIVQSDGLIITNKHVVADTDAKYTVLTNDKKKFNVEKIFRDPLNDLAIIKINATNLKALPLGDSSNLKLGQLVVAIGTPLGEFTNTVTTGIVSGLGRGITAGSPFEGFVEKLDNVIQTDAAINPGNSGGPLLNSKGQVIGISTAIASDSQNIGFAIPVNVVKDLIESFEARGGVFERPFIGVRYKTIDKNTAVLNDLVEGAYVIAVVKSSPAEKAGIQEEDIILEFEGKGIKGDDDRALTKEILNKKIGDTVTLKIWRAGKVQTIRLILEGSSQ